MSFNLDKMVTEKLKNIELPTIPGIKMARPNARLLGFIAFYFIFLVLGAAIFSAIESPDEADIIRDLRRRRLKFLKEHPCVSDSDLEDLILIITNAGARGVSAANNASAEPNWSFGQSFFFSSTVISTIGYGHVHPLSEGGKIFCIVYAVVGIPMTFMLLAAFVERLLIPATWLLYWMNSKLGHLYQPFNIRVFHLLFIGVLSFMILMVVPALILTKIEPEWGFLDSIYYCFISLTTIGLGDYIPGDSPDQKYRPLYKICIAAYMFIGLTFVMFLLHLYHEIPQLNLGFFLAREPDIQPDPERLRLSNATAANYTQNEDLIRQSVKVVSRPLDSPSPEEDTTPIHAKLPPLPSH